MASEENCSLFRDSKDEQCINDNFVKSPISQHICSDCQDSAVMFSQNIAKETTKSNLYENSETLEKTVVEKTTIYDDHEEVSKVNYTTGCCNESRKKTGINQTLQLIDEQSKTCFKSTENKEFEEKVESLTFSKTIINQSYCDPEGGVKNEVLFKNTSLHGETRIVDSSHTQNIRDSNTPCKDILFRKGVTFTSTPLHENNMKHVIENLSAIKEEEENVSHESDLPKAVITENIVIPDNPNVFDLPSNHTQKHFSDLFDLNTLKNISDLSVLKKDELSLLIDLPNETILKEESIDFRPQNLTLSVKNSESIVYNNLVDKTVDDLLIEDGELVSFKQLNSLETESDRKEILNKATALKEFISPDADENKDNNDPEWELLKRLETDDERYKAVRKIWRNLAIPDLKQNLSTFNWRKKNSLPAMKNITPIKTVQIGKKKKMFTYDCTEVFDVGMKKLYDFYERQVQGIQLDCDNDTSIMASLSKKPRLESEFSLIPRRNYGADLEKLKGCVQERLHRYREAKEEIKAVHGFYNGLKNQGNGGYGNMMLISHTERQCILDIENMINNYTSWYPDHA